MAVLARYLPEHVQVKVRRIVLDALHEAGVPATPGRTPFGIAQADVWSHFRASQVSRRAAGLPVWADAREWAEANTREQPILLGRYVRAGMLPEGWQP